MLNTSIIMGRLTADPELRQTPSGEFVCTFNVAVDRNFSAQGQKREADFIPVVAWKKTAEFVSRYFSKGKMIAVSGSLRTRSYNDKNFPDVKHYVMELYANEVNFCGDRSQEQNTAPNTPSYASTANNTPQQSQAPQRAAQSQIQQTSFNDFEEIISNDDVPF